MAKKIKNIAMLEAGEGNKNVEIITGTIISRAQKAAESIIRDAQTLAEEDAANKTANLDAYCAKMINDARQTAGNITAYSEMLAEMESKASVQNSLAHILDRTFFEAEKNILKLPDDKYVALIERMIKKYAESGDELIIAKNEKRLTADWLKQVNAKFKLNLKLSDETEDFSGGLIIRNKIYDKNLTISALLKEIRSDIQPEILGVITGQEA